MAVDRIYRTRDLNWWQKLLQAYWFNPASMLLAEITFSAAGDVVVRTRSGKVFRCPLADVKATFATDSHGRREVKLVAPSGEKLRFKQIGWMLADEEWDEVFSALQARKSLWGHLTDVAGKALGAAS